MKQNLIINLPTGTGKNFIIAHALKPNKFSYMILVPRIIHTKKLIFLYFIVKEYNNN